MLTVALSLAIAPISVSYARQYHNPNSQLTKASDGNKKIKGNNQKDKKSKENTKKKDAESKKSDKGTNKSKVNTQKKGGIKALIANKTVLTAVICIIFIIALLVIYITGARKNSKEHKLKE